MDQPISDLFAFDSLLKKFDAICVVVAGDRSIKRMNEAAELAIGWTETEALGQPFEVVFPREASEDLRESTTEDGPGISTGYWLTKAGERKYIVWHCSAILSQIEEGGESLLGIGYDLTEEADQRAHLEKALADLHEIQVQIETRNRELEDANRRLRTDSLTDPLTGQWNRRAFSDRLTSEASLARRHNLVFSVLMIDVDHFRDHNDRTGFSDADHLLVAISSTIRRTLRNSDFIARYGGEEFAAILPQTNLSQAKETGERIRRAVELEKFRKGTLTVSIGTSTFQADDSPATLLERVDAALMLAKQNGRNRVE